MCHFVTYTGRPQLEERTQDTRQISASSCNHMFVQVLCAVGYLQALASTSLSRYFPIGHLTYASQGPICWAWARVSGRRWVARAGAGRESGFLPTAPPIPRLASLPVPIQPSSSAALGRAAANCREGQARGCPPHPGGIPVTCQRCHALLQVALTCQHRVHCALHPEQVGIPGILQHHGHGKK